MCQGMCVLMCVCVCMCVRKGICTSNVASSILLFLLLHPYLTPSSEPAHASLFVTADSGDSSSCTKSQQWHSREGASSNGVRAGTPDSRVKQLADLFTNPQIPTAFCF